MFPLSLLDGVTEASLSTSVATAITLGTFALVVAAVFLQVLRKSTEFPTIRVGEVKSSMSGRAPNELVITDIFKKTWAEFRKPFKVVFPDLGENIVLSNSYVEEIRNIPELSLLAAGDRDFFPHYPGFDAFKIGQSGPAFLDAVRVKLTQALIYFTHELSEEANVALPEIYHKSNEWQEAQIYATSLDLVARLSSLIFLGRDFEHVKQWQKISASYAYNVFHAAQSLREWPPILRPIVHWFLPATKRLRAQVKEAKSIITPEVNQRRQRREEDLKKGTKTKKSLDSIDWFDDCARASGENFDFVGGELSLAVVAIHTTTMTMVNTMLDICDHNLAPPLREEIIKVVKEDGGLQRTSLHKLKLMDSVLKETQRAHPLTQAAMRRRVMGDVTLSDGTTLKKDQHIFVSPTPELDAQKWPDPFTYDGWRFVKLRQAAGEENKHQFTTTTSNHLGFGHGLHACPGRFFASNEIKIALMHMLMKYDWKLPDGEPRPHNLEVGVEIHVTPAARLMYKARTPEINI